MGVGVSGWALARSVAVEGQLGVVSGTALDAIMIRRLASGDPGGHVRRALAAFPIPDLVKRVLHRFLPRDVPSVSGAAPDLVGQRFRTLPLLRAKQSPEREWLLVLANFVEVYLAREGHSGVVGINYLHKIQFPVLPSLYGAILAGVNVMLMGAGIPGEIPAVMDRLSQHDCASAALEVLDGGDRRFELSFNPASVWEEHGLEIPPPAARPDFLAIVSSATLARALLKKAPGGIQGFVVELPIAGGHNAPPRGVQQLSCRGEPVYGERDVVDFASMAALGVPFWLAGGYATREKFNEALSVGARGIQVGTAFAFCDESGLDPALRRRFLAGVLRGEGEVFTDPSASPTRFPFKVADMTGTLSEDSVYDRRPRMCDMGYLRRAYLKSDGTLDYRCPAEPIGDYVRKGGKADDAVGRKCLCNGLVANLGLGQRRPDGYEEPPLLTAGDDLECLKPFISPDRLSYHAKDVICAIMPAERQVSSPNCATTPHAVG
jgi:NAD(P)H-dependent flavin oxidoreductase YrpB (nitropropane dioxygenase family)